MRMVESAVLDETKEMNESIVPNELPVKNKVEVIKEVAEIDKNKVQHLSKSEELVKEIVPEMSETINENGLNESAVSDETGEMNENTLNESIVPNELSVNSEVEVIRKVAEINENKVAQKEEHLSKSEGLVKENIEQVSEIIRNELSNEDENSIWLEVDLRKEFKDEIRKIKLGMLKLIEQVQYVEKDTKVIEIEDVERIEIKTEFKKLKKPQTGISKQMKQGKDREKVKEKER